MIVIKYHVITNLNEICQLLKTFDEFCELRTYMKLCLSQPSWKLADSGQKIASMHFETTSMLEASLSLPSLEIKLQVICLAPIIPFCSLSAKF